MYVNDCQNPLCCFECPVMCILADMQGIHFWILDRRVINVRVGWVPYAGNLCLQLHCNQYFLSDQYVR